MNNIDVNALLEVLSKMDKKDLEEGFNKASKILQNQNNSKKSNKQGNN